MCNLKKMALVYSCCFWFSIRLAGILIGSFSIGFLFLVFFIAAYGHIQEIKDEIIFWISNLNLIYTKELMEKIVQDPEGYLTVCTVSTCLYIVICSLYIYGAYTFTNTLMYAYIIMEVIRLILISMGTITWLLVLKRNTMDIGLLIGASVICGFVLLGMFYLWVCTASLPVLINEMELEEQTATIAKLQILLKTQNQSFHQDRPTLNDNGFYQREPFVITGNRRSYY